MFGLVFPGEGRYRNLHCNIRTPLPSTHFSVHYSLSYYHKLCNDQATRQAMSLKRNIKPDRSIIIAVCICSLRHSRMLTMCAVLYRVFQKELYNFLKHPVLSFGSVRLHHIFIHYLINGTIDFRGGKNVF